MPATLIRPLPFRILIYLVVSLAKGEAARVVGSGRTVGRFSRVVSCVGGCSFPKENCIPGFSKSDIHGDIHGAERAKSYSK